MPATSTTVCSLCGKTLEREGNCLACLLRGGLDESEEEPLPSSLVFGDFEIERRDDGSYWELGRGAMGVTYRARDKVLHRKVALKVIDIPAQAGDARIARERFLREARTAGTLRHPNVASVFQFGASPEGDRCYYAMELVEGETLEAFVRRDGPLPAGAALEISIQISRALVAAAGHNLIHRDLKPANIMLGANESGTAGLEAKVIDFGLAKATVEAAGETDLTHGAFVGTPTFASPEQLAGQPADARSDIYSLGITLWYALTGEVPRAGMTLEEIRSSSSKVALPIEQLTARRVPASVVRLLRRTLANDPVERPQSARALLHALDVCRAATSEGRRRRKAALFFGVLALGILGLTTYLRNRQPEVAAVASGKSIAVLPFESLSKDKESAFFTDAVHEQILTDLAKVADLKVINRTSVMQYKPTATRNLREIAQQLGVAHVLEGSVQRADGKVRIKAQLTNTSSNAKEWAENYDRPFGEVSAIQSEIAKAIAAELQAKLSPREQAAIAVASKTDFIASALYQQALVLQDKYPWYENGLESVRLLDEAIARDPKFAVAYDLLGLVHISLYFGGYDHTPARRELARATIEKADRLQPGAGEVHLAWARYAYYCTENYDHARAELDLAQRTLPNNSEIYFTRAYIAQTQGRWSEALREAEHSVELDPRSRRHVSMLGGIYEDLRRYAEALPFLQRAVELPPFDNYTRIELALLPFYAQADTRPLRKELSAVLARDPKAGENYGDLVRCALLERDLAATERAIALVPNERLYPREWYAGLAARMSHNPEAARIAFTAARPLVEKRLLAHPDYAQAWSLLGRIDAALGHNEDAVREGLRACELLPLSKNSWRGAQFVTDLALIYTWINVNDLALEQLALSARVPGGASYGQLKLDPQWDALRGDSRFEKIVASLAPPK